jgi:hypothetical protein
VFGTIGTHEEHLEWARRHAELLGHRRCTSTTASVPRVGTSGFFASTR